MTQQFHFWVCAQKNRRRDSRRDLYSMFRAALFTIVKGWKQASCVRMNG